MDEIDWDKIEAEYEASRRRGRERLITPVELLPKSLAGVVDALGLEAVMEEDFRLSLRPSASSASNAVGTAPSPS